MVPQVIVRVGNTDGEHDAAEELSEVDSWLGAEPRHQVHELEVARALVRTLSVDVVCQRHRGSKVQPLSPRAAVEPPAEKGVVPS